MSLLAAARRLKTIYMDIKKGKQINQKPMYKNNFNGSEK